MRNRIRRSTAAVAVSLVAIGSVGGMVALSATAGASVPAISAKNCKSVSKHHYKTPHKDGDRDGCDKHGLDDGDGRTT